MNLASKDILGTEQLSREEIEGILDTALSFKEVSTRQIKKVPTLRGRTIINLFFEASTRTRTSFEIAGPTPETLPHSYSNKNTPWSD